MTTVLKNFVSVKKTRGDVLHPATATSIVEMIIGISKEYDFAGFNDAYKDFLAHLLNFNDPHKVTDAGFLEEIITFAYSVYEKMTATPLTEEEFRETIVPELTFLELLRRIFLNHWVYSQVKNLDGSVPETISITLTEDWGRNVDTTTPVTISFGTELPNEDEFIFRGWSGNSTPIPIVFNADDLTSAFSVYEILFHTSTATPYETPTGGSFGYPVSLTGSSNDLAVAIKTTAYPSQSTVLFSLINISNTLTITMSETGAISVKLNTLDLFTNIPCSDAELRLRIQRNGQFSLTVSNNSIETTSYTTQSLNAIGQFTTGIVGVALTGPFSPAFGLKELSVYKPSVQLEKAPEIIPLIFYTSPAESLTVNGTATTTRFSEVFTPEQDRKVYLTLSDAWVGSVIVQISRDSGSTWHPMTYDGSPVGAYSTNCDESIGVFSGDTTRLRLSITILSGSLSYRIAQ